MKKYNEREEKEIEVLAKQYREFLDLGKTERECAENICRIAREHGFRDLEEILEKGETLKAGDKIYASNMKKGVLMMEIGEEDLEKGMLFVGSHIDSPRLDIKQNPFYENSGMAYMDTHYYGGIKKYQWVASPMAIHGTVVKTDGTSVEIIIGENAEDPVVGVTDLLVHLSAQQMDKKGSVVIEGEALDLLVGTRPVDDEKAENPVKTYVLNLLKEKYGIEERDFVSAELEVVPAGKARDFGLDASMIMAYGQDDRICAFCSLMAFLHSETKRTKVCLFVDKEEIGSVGATGMESRFMENTVAEVMNCLGQYSELKLRRALKNSSMLSADVNAGYDPLYAEAFEKNNAAFLGKGATNSKYTGARGKGGSNDANAEYLGRLRQVFEANDVMYQTAELGKIDVGGGGTIAYITAAYGMEVVDLGVPILNMHAPYEVSSKIDVYETSKCYKAFYEM
ncbi:MAG: aminopeptidase [Clostridiales bacterium]|nr:aminopeptidase [Clostridiales bacterium]